MSLSCSSLIIASFPHIALVFAYTCEVVAGGALVHCCETQTDLSGLEITYCIFCDNTKPPSNRTRRSADPDPDRSGGGDNPVPKSPPPAISTEPPPVASPKVCPPTTQAPIDQGTTLPTENHKGSNLNQLGGSLLNNNPAPPPTGDNTAYIHTVAIS